MYCALLLSIADSNKKQDRCSAEKLHPPHPSSDRKRKGSLKKKKKKVARQLVWRESVQFVTPERKDL